VSIQATAAPSLASARRYTCSATGASKLPVASTNGEVQRLRKSSVRATTTLRWPRSSSLQVATNSPLVSAARLTLLTRPAPTLGRVCTCQVLPSCRPW
jgi:hypothetical protein